MQIHVLAGDFEDIVRSRFPRTVLLPECCASPGPVVRYLGFDADRGRGAGAFEIDPRWATSLGTDAVGALNAPERKAFARFEQSLFYAARGSKWVHDGSHIASH
jgi:hypothetical protein